MKEEHDFASLSAFLDALERRLERKFPGAWPSFRVVLCEKKIELCFDTREHAENARRGLLGRIVEPRGAPDAVFRYWVDDCAEYISRDHLSSRWCVRNADGQITYIAGSRFTAADYQHNIFYHCQPVGLKTDYTQFSHGMTDLLEEWGRKNGLLMLHGAAVGVDGKGVIIAGKGGAGKSTLSVACLMAGMDFVGDDYFMLTGSGILQAMPVYSSVCLNPDMVLSLGLDLPRLWERKNGKLEFDASAYPFAKRLSIRGLVLPAFGEERRIDPVPNGSAIAKITYSTAKQLCGIPDQGLVRTIAERLRSLPAFEFCQCGDLRENAEYLRQFIKKEL